MTQDLRLWKLERSVINKKHGATLYTLSNRFRGLTCWNQTLFILGFHKCRKLLSWKTLLAGVTPYTPLSRETRLSHLGMVLEIHSGKDSRPKAYPPLH